MPQQLTRSWTELLPVLQIEEMNRPIYEPMSKYLERNKIKQEILKIVDFEVPLYIIDDIAQNEDYNHICLMIITL